MFTVGIVYFKTLKEMVPLDKALDFFCENLEKIKNLSIGKQEISDILSANVVVPNSTYEIYFLN